MQVMSAGKGILHAEYNYESEPTQIFQIWIRTRETGVAPRWETRRFPSAGRAGQLVALASGRAGDEGALAIHQDAAILGAQLANGQSVRHELGTARKAYLVATRGRIEVNGTPAEARDGVVASGEETLTIAALEDSEIVLVDVA
jgi:redox-sensitive bicupin YhaK (pirin superfamily)